MPKRRAAVKSLRVDSKRHERNLKIKKELKKTVKKYLGLVAEKSADAKATLQKVYSLLDRAAKKNILHANKAGRVKSRLSRKLPKAA